MVLLDVVSGIVSGIVPKLSPVVPEFSLLSWFEAAFTACFVWLTPVMAANTMQNQSLANLGQK